MISFQHSVSWKLSKDNTRYLGHIVLHKELLADGRGRQSIGMKVVGDKLVDSAGHYGAKVEKVRTGSLADRVAHIEPGEWKKYPTIILLLILSYGQNNVVFKFVI